MNGYGDSLIQREKNQLGKLFSGADGAMEIFFHSLPTSKPTQVE